MKKVKVNYNKTNKYLYLQAIDYSGKTIISLSSKTISYANPNIVIAREIGEKISDILLKRNIYKINFIKKCLKYHGKARSCAESIKKEGLEL